MEHHLQSGIAGLEAAAVILLFFAFLFYPLAAALTSMRYKGWPLYRLFLWSLGIFTIAISFTGPFSSAQILGS